jgi:hypothetical protein
MKRISWAGSYVLLALSLGGCSTLTGDFHQKLQIDALDAQNRPIDGMRCQVGTGSSAKTVVTPATEVRVRRAMASLEIECQRDSLVASATVKSRRERMEEALLPFGSVGVFVDHLSGSLYSYPTALHLRVGQHLVLEHGGEAQVVKSEPLTPAPPPASASVSAQRSNPPAVQTSNPVAAQAAAAARTASSPTSSPGAQPPANAVAASTRQAAAQKRQAAQVSKSDRANSKPIKTAHTATATKKTRTASSGTASSGTASSGTGSSKLAVTAPAAATAAAVMPVAPTNW